MGVTCSSVRGSSNEQSFSSQSSPEIWARAGEDHVPPRPTRKEPKQTAEDAQDSSVMTMTKLSSVLR